MWQNEQEKSCSCEVVIKKNPLPWRTSARLFLERCLILQSRTRPVSESKKNDGDGRTRKEKLSTSSRPTEWFTLEVCV
jgi:hypothetical protein